MIHDYAESSDSDGVVAADCGQPGPSCRPKCTRQLLARFCVESDRSGSDNNQREICDKHVREGVTAACIFWIDCDKCGCWIYTACAFGNNFISMQWLCLKIC